MRRIRFIAQKELYHILRDPRSLVIVFVMPVMMTFLYGYAINMDIENVTMAVIDQDKSAESRELIDRFYQSGYFAQPEQPSPLDDPDRILRAGEANGVLMIRPGFGQAIQQSREFELGLLVDGSETSMAAAVQAYATQIVNLYQRSRIPPGTTIPGITISQQLLYNPDLESSHFFVPGIVAIILLMISALLTSITIAREKETGTLEQLLTAPVKPSEILVGKLMPYIVIAFLDGALVLGFAKFWFDVPIEGSVLLLWAFELVYVASALSLGILISAVVRTQQVAMMLALTTTMLPTVMLSGFIFAIKNMPLPLQVISNIIPAKYFLIIVRGIMLKGSGFEILAPQAGYLMIITVILLVIATRKFKTKVA